MSVIRYPGTELVIGDPVKIPLQIDGPGLNDALLDRALKGMILSASGWRGVFAAGGGEETRTPEISAAHAVIAAAAAKVFADYLKRTSGAAAPAVIIGMDTRPTGPAIADVMTRVFMGEGCAVGCAFITAAPEIMAFARAAADADAGAGFPASGFVFISASHNPIGYNGLKFGRTDGGVLPGSETAFLIDGFNSFMAAPGRISRATALVSRTDTAALARVYSDAPRIKAAALAAYLRFTREVVSGAAEPARQAELFAVVTAGLKERPLGVVADLNGSARTVSIDREFLSGLGASYRAINDGPGNIAHRIVPEGESLEPCRVFLEEVHREDPAFVLGYVPDCDGDRGNLVIWDDGGGRARTLEAQEVFALACVSELAQLVWTRELSFDAKGKALQKTAVAVNDPTSMRIDRIARAFDVPVFRAEVGEANVVSLARKLRERGCAVRILGEGSAGGNITHPSAVRDPINTAAALIKLLTVRSLGNRPGLFELWCGLSGQAGAYRPDFTLSDIIATLPPFVTTGSYTPEALLTINTADHALLKDRYQEVFLREWEERKEYLKTRYSITGWTAAAYQGTEEKLGISRFGEAGRGGLRIIFVNTAGAETACIWMRGSGTEPVFRVMADAEGSDKRLERELIEWQRRMVAEADGGR
ncbi:MAG: phosphatidylglycerol lysyltransferase [Spirochaetaceae bacterium]|jgi:phosphoglucomutase|nr:phosphatidylglycerol lysyltransferase [Spirochaetaceae bacterium]